MLHKGNLPSIRKKYINIIREVNWKLEWPHELSEKKNLGENYIKTYENNIASLHAVHYHDYLTSFIYRQIWRDKTRWYSLTDCKHQGLNKPFNLSKSTLYFDKVASSFWNALCEINLLHIFKGQKHDMHLLLLNGVYTVLKTKISKRFIWRNKSMTLPGQAISNNDVKLENCIHTSHTPAGFH